MGNVREGGFCWCLVMTCTSEKKFYLLSQSDVSHQLLNFAVEVQHGACENLSQTPVALADMAA